MKRKNTLKKLIVLHYMRNNSNGIEISSDVKQTLVNLVVKS